MDLSAMLKVVSNRGFSYRWRFSNCLSEGGIVTLDGLLTDTGITDQHIVKIDWGDDALAIPTVVTGIRFTGGDQADLLRVQGLDLVRLQFDAGAGDDSLLYNAAGTHLLE